VATLRLEVARLRSELQERVHVTEERKHTLELVLFDHNVTLRGTQEVLELAYGAPHRPSLQALQARLQQHGQHARRLLNEALSQVQGRVRCVMGDDVFFHRQDVKVVAEPRSMAILQVGRWEGRSAEEWWLWLSG